MYSGLLSQILSHSSGEKLGRKSREGLQFTTWGELGNETEVQHSLHWVNYSGLVTSCKACLETVASIHQTVGVNLVMGTVLQFSIQLAVQALTLTKESQSCCMLIGW